MKKQKAAISRPKTQSQKLKRLNQAITRRELTKSLEILAQSQIEGEFANFVISNLQNLMTGGEV